MSVYISVVSHGHGDLINHLNCLSKLNGYFNVIVKSNCLGDDLNRLCENSNFHWLNNDFFKGFGENNNIVFKYCLSNLNMKETDYFIVLNPDVVVEPEMILSLIEMMRNEQEVLASINLFKDDGLSTPDFSIREFPKLSHFIASFCGFQNKSIIDKTLLNNKSYVDWAAGSFLAFSVAQYKKLGGFDESYFMYCEDIDICFRSFILGRPVAYYPTIKAVHLAKHANRKIFSKHFYWHVTGVFRFLFKKFSNR